MPVSVVTAADSQGRPAVRPAALSFIQRLQQFRAWWRERATTQQRELDYYFIRSGLRSPGMQQRALNDRRGRASVVRGNSPTQRQRRNRRLHSARSRAIVVRSQQRAQRGVGATHAQLDEQMAPISTFAPTWLAQVGRAPSPHRRRRVPKVSSSCICLKLARHFMPVFEHQKAPDKLAFAT